MRTSLLDGVLAGVWAGAGLMKGCCAAPWDRVWPAHVHELQPVTTFSSLLPCDAPVFLIYSAGLPPLLP